MKRWGPKKEGMIQRPVPTPIDHGILPKEVTLLQYAYSDMFSGGVGGVLVSLLRKFAYIFSPYINHVPLRHAILACAAAFVPSYPPTAERSEYHSSCVRKALIGKILKGTVDEADLFASFLQTFLSCLYNDFSLFSVHIRGFVAIMKAVKRKAIWKDRNCMSMFWPLTRDILVDVSRFVPCSSGLVYEFCENIREELGIQRFVSRSQYFSDLMGNVLDRHYAFTYTIWCYCTILRRCFRDSVWRQSTGQFMLSDTYWFSCGRNQG